jgi:hypothetical protein
VKPSLSDMRLLLLAVLCFILYFRQYIYQCWGFSSALLLKFGSKDTPICPSSDAIAASPFKSRIAHMFPICKPQHLLRFTVLFNIAMYGTGFISINSHLNSGL